MGGNDGYGVYPPHGGDGFYPPGGAPPYPPHPGQYPPPPGAYQDRAFELDSPLPPSHYPPMSGGYPPPPMYEHDHGHHHHHHHHHSQHDEFPREGSFPEPYGSGRRPGPPPRPTGQLVKIFSMANTDYNLAVRHDGVVLVPANPHDESQKWIKDMSWSTRVKDEKGFPAFALINNATNQALKHSEEAQQVLLTDYTPGAIDETTLWSESEDMGRGFKTVRMANNIKLNLDAFKGDKKSGGIKDGTPAILFKWKKQDNQLWKIVPLCKPSLKPLLRSLLFDLRNVVTMQDLPRT